MNSFQKLGVYEIMWNIVVEPYRAQMTCGACALHAVYLRLQIYSQNIQGVPGGMAKISGECSLC